MPTTSPLRNVVILTVFAFLAIHFHFYVGGDGRLAPNGSAAFAADFTLREHLGRDWRHERVTFPLDQRQLAKVQAGLALRTADGQAVPYQRFIADNTGEHRIAFQVDLPSYSELGFSFVDQPAPAAKSDLLIEETPAEITLSNSRIGLRLRRNLEIGAGPIAGIRLGMGPWTDGSKLADLKSAVTSCDVTVKTRGPVFASVESRVAFTDGGEWRLEFRLENDEPVVVVHERFDCPGGGRFSVPLSGERFRPTHMFHRNADVTNMAVMSDPITGYQLEPWLRWSNPRHGTWVALHRPPEPNAVTSTTPDMLVAAMLKPSLWVDPQWQGKAPQTSPAVPIHVQEGQGQLEFALGGGGRVWLIGALPQAESVALLSQSNKRVAPPPQKLVLKHSDFPLDKVKDFVLDWSGDHDNHPRLYVKKADLPKLRQRVPSNPSELARWTSQQPIDKYLLDGPIREYIATGNDRLGELMARRAEEYLRDTVDWYLTPNERLTPGAAPHMQTLILTVVNLIDPVLSSESFNEEQRRRVLARLAFLGYTVASPDYWSPERGFTGFANMTSVVAMYRLALGCLLPSHPRAKEWAQLGLEQLEWQLNAWSDEDGGWIEAPHYAMVSFDHLLAGFTMAANAGYSNRLFDPRMRKVLEWFAAISTPRDARTGGWRHQPPIGNTYHGEPNGVFGIAAAAWKDRDPDFAARMQWMFEQHGQYPGLGSGWNFPTMLGYRFLMNASGVAAKPTDFGSRLFRETGVVLRNTMEERETYLHMIAGGNHAHYDADSGSLLIYGKGRVLCDDWGYLGLHPEKWHSMVTGQHAPGGDVMRVAAFAPSPGFDYVLGDKAAWQRRIGFVKDANPLGPSFFVIQDGYGETAAADGAATWRLWLTTGIVAGVGKRMPSETETVPATPETQAVGKRSAADELLESLKPASKRPEQQVTPRGVALLAPYGARLSGMEDVDLEIHLHEPSKLSLVLEPAKLRTSTGNWMGSIEPVENSQTALTATIRGPGRVAAVLFPRLKTEEQPRVAWSGDGSVVEVRTAGTTDYVYLAPRPTLAAEAVGPRANATGAAVTAEPKNGRERPFVSSPDGVVAFQGTAGHVRISAGQATMTLGAAGAVRIAGQVWRVTEPATRNIPVAR
ncbi:MAG: hypothetical protein ACKO38_11610 [Planctomycetota bacterium]